MAETVKLVPREVREAGYPEARFLSEGEQAKYEEACKRFSLDKAQDSLRIPLKGSNLWKVLLLNDIGIRTASIPELECALENGLDLRGTYEDGYEVILRSKGDTYEKNDFVAKDLAKKLKIRGSIKTPLIVTGLKPAEKEDSDYGLALETTNKTNVIKAPDFAHKNNRRKFARINPDYSIEFDENGSGTLYTRDSGLSGLYLREGLGLDSDDDDLAASNDYGRVVVVSDKPKIAEGNKKLENIGYM